MSYYTGYDRDEVIGFMREHAFAFVTGFGDTFPVASQLPLEVIENPNGEITLTGHLMRKTDHHLAFEKNQNVLVVFHSPHAYINANWYEDKAQASTVNYMAVHAKGKISFTDEAGTLAAIRDLTDKHIGTGTAASFENISQDYIDSMLKAIVGFSIAVESLEHVFKLSQNRNASDQQQIVEHLTAEKNVGASYIAKEMGNRLHQK